eukprot:gene3088-2070_t
MVFWTDAHFDIVCEICVLAVFSLRYLLLDDCGYDCSLPVFLGNIITVEGFVGFCKFGGVLILVVTVAGVWWVEREVVIVRRVIVWVGSVGRNVCGSALTMREFLVAGFGCLWAFRGGWSMLLAVFVAVLSGCLDCGHGQLVLRFALVLVRNMGGFLICFSDVVWVVWVSLVAGTSGVLVLAVFCCGCLSCCTVGMRRFDALFWVNWWSIGYSSLIFRCFLADLMELSILDVGVHFDCFWVFFVRLDGM